MADPLHDHPRSPGKADKDDDDIKIGTVRTGKQLMGREDKGEYEYLGFDPDSEGAALEPSRRGDRKAHDEANKAYKKWDEGEQKKRSEGKPWGGDVNPGPTIHDLTSKPTRGLWRRRDEKPTS